MDVTPEFIMNMLLMLFFIFYSSILYKAQAIGYVL